MFKFLQRKLEIYKSIDELPVWNWFKIHETNDLSYLLKITRKVGYARTHELEAQWSLIHDEFLDTFGVNDKLRQIYELKRDISVLKADMFLEKDPSKETLIDLKELELKNILNETTKTDVYEVKAYVEKYMGRRVDERTETVKSYYSCIKIMEKELSKQPERWQATK